MVDTQAIERAKEQFGKVLEEQLARVDRLKSEPDWIDYNQEKPIIVGMLGGDGIGPFISAESQTVLEHLLKAHVASGKVQFPARLNGSDSFTDRHLYRSFGSFLFYSNHNDTSTRSSKQALCQLLTN